MRMRAPALAFVLLGAALAGCLSSPAPLAPPAAAPPSSYAHLAAPGSSETIDSPEGVRTFAFEGTTSGPGIRVLFLVLPPATAFLDEPFDTDGTVGYVEVTLDYTGSALDAYLVDDQGRVQCGANSGAPPKRCTAPGAPNQSKAAWRVQVLPGQDPVLPGDAFQVQVALHPLAHIPYGDPLAGVDPAIRFRVTTTGSEASEPLIGVLSDGTIFAQHGISTMRSRDDGATWQDVTPPTQVESFDPMMYVDPWSDTVYVDHLLIVCSNLAWSTDAGDTWVPNPAACGAPANDHQKLAVGPSLLPAFNAVYYAYSSFAAGVWVSRSLDGGLTWTTSLVAGIGDGRDARNTGPVHADRAGNVFVPYHFCDGEGYVGVGVSHDMGLTWKVVEVDPEPLDCSGDLRPDADPGISVDADGTVYVAYHRPSGIKYVSSTDHGDSWSEPIPISPPTLTSFVHVAATAGDPGKLAVAYRATPDTARGANGADGWARWFMYVTFVEDAASAAPRITTGMAHDVADPVQRGSICNSGIACAGGNRNLLDFIDMEVTPDGRVVVTYADGCDKDCPTPADSRADDHGPVSILEEGPRLFAGKPPWA